MRKNQRREFPPHELDAAMDLVALTDLESAKETEERLRMLEAANLGEASFDALFERGLFLPGDDAAHQTPSA